MTNTNRFYDADSEVRHQEIKYVKIQCRGHGETPTRDNTDLFIKIVDSFISKNPTELIGVHCTHGFNRTGFLICSYLVEKLDFGVDMAVSLFAESRPPGIYKQDYLNELFKRYESEADAPIAPELPTWETEDDKQTSLSDEDEDANRDEQDVNPAKRARFQNGRRPRREESRVNPVFAEPGIEGVEPCSDSDEISRVRVETQGICNWGGAGFPGAQPISMDQKNVALFFQKKYRVSWKADGTR